MGKKDLSLKSYLEDVVRYADIMNAVFFSGKQIVKPEELEDTRSITTKADDEALVEAIGDVVMKQSCNGEMFALWVLENQEKIDYSMPIRVMLKEALEYDKQIKIIKKRNKKANEPYNTEDEFLYKVKRNDKIYPIHTLVIYWGDKPWDGPRSLHECLDFYYDNPDDITRIKQMTPEYSIHLLDLSQIQDYSKFHTELRIVLELYALRQSKDKMYRYVESHEDCEHLDEETYRMIGILVNEKELLKRKERYKNEKGEFGMCKAIRDLMEDAREEGRQEGRGLVNRLYSQLKNDNRTEELLRAIDDYEYCMLLMEEYGMA